MQKNNILTLVCSFFQRRISQIINWLVNKNIPILTKILIKIFIKFYKINMNEFKKNKISDYSNFNEFFTRKLKKNSRPILTNENQIAFPVDGIINQIGLIINDQIFQTKNHFFNLFSLLGGNYNFNKNFFNGFFVTTYLSPKNYHRVHMPCDGFLKEMIYIPGKLFILNLNNSKKIKNIFSKSERLICIFKTKFGYLAQILIGATIVGNIDVIWHGLVNKKHEGIIKKWNYPKKNKKNAIFLKKGEEMGKFYLGSTVINLFESHSIKLNSLLKRGSIVKIGELLAESFYKIQ